MSGRPIDWRQRLGAATAGLAVRAHAPYSGFAVVAVVMSADGSIHPGVNIENAAFPSGQCAEASAIGNLVTALGPQPIVAVAVRAPNARWLWPCGNCRQKLAEFAAPDCQVLAIDADQRERVVPLADLLPHAFTELTGGAGETS